jgi:hypothetical protein
MNYTIKKWRLKENEKDEITEYVISKIILPKVLLLRDIPTLRTLLFIFNYIFGAKQFASPLG